MKKTIILLSTFIGLIILSSCGSPRMSTANDLTILKIGLEKSKIDSMYKFENNDEYGDEMFEFEFDNQKYTCQTTDIINYQHISYSKSSSGGSTYRNTYFGYDYFCLIYQNNKLVTYGYIYEYLFNASNRWNQFGLAVIDGIKINKERKLNKKQGKK